MSNALTEALERSAMPQEAKNTLAVVERYRPHLVKLLGSEQAALRFETEVRSYLRANPALIECEPTSIAAGALWAAQLGLSLGPLGLFYLVPFRKQAVPVIGYKGLAALAYGSGQVKDLHAHLVYVGEAFKEYGGSSPRLVHEIDRETHDDEIVAAYAVAKLRTGGTVWKVIGEREWERARASSQLGSQNRGPWVESRPEMIRKTAIRRLAGSGELPLTPLMQDALQHDEEPQDAPPLAEPVSDPKPPDDNGS